MNIDFALEFEQPGLAQARKILAEKLNIQINLHEHNALSFADLLEPRHCAMVLGEFQSRIQALNLTCSGSMFIKYWAVPLLFPYLYALLTEQLDLPWQLSALSVQMAPTWSWDQHLNFKASSLSLTALSTQNSGYEVFMLKVFHDLNQIFQVIGQVAKVQRFLLWENTALRILQFYDLMQRKNPDDIYKNHMHRQFLLDLEAERFGLKHNPFLLLQHSRQSSLENYQRKKCCFYFQLPEAENEYCGSCPLANKHP
ncbi:(2Fe-2S)-binding protein [Acinetobacter radioresistens]|uniref:(2Fe-2S)-binding protein n=1 Tax=Acinetobacter radioresistens TaxID=40216 RepID=UPI002AF6C827|nr:(2Fe-2S)-binding protein [Acinetobacter radioresistens]